MKPLTKFFVGVCLLSIPNLSRADCSTQAPDLDFFAVVSNSLRHPGPRQQVAQDFVYWDQEISNFGFNFYKGVTLPWDLGRKQGFYSARPNAGKLIVFYVNDDAPNSQIGLCDANNLNSGCQDQDLSDIEPLLQAWLGMTPTLFLEIHFHNGMINGESVVSYNINGMNAIQPGMTPSQIVLDFVNQAIVYQCGPGGIGV